MFANLSPLKEQTMAKLTKAVFAQITKVDLESRTVTGVATSERVDKDREIMDYATSKPLFKAWSEAAQARSNGKSFGNVREMHTLKASGFLPEPMIFDDQNRSIVVKAEVVDDDTWAKIQKGVLTGFSIAGRVSGTKWVDKAAGAVRYTVQPGEISLVDNPCNDDATFFAIKADGSEEVRKFATDVPDEEVQKGLWSVADLASAISALKWTHDDLEFCEEMEDGEMDDEVSGEIKAALTSLIAAFQALAAKEGDKIVAQMKSFGALRLEVAKAGKKHSKATMDAVAIAKKQLDRIGKAHAAATGAMAHFDGATADPSTSDQTAKASGATTPEGEGAINMAMDPETKAALDAITKSIADLSTKVEEGNKVTTEKAEQAIKAAQETGEFAVKLANSLAGAAVPAKTHSGVTAVSKAADNGSASGDVKNELPANATQQEKDAFVMKGIFASGGREMTAQDLHELNLGRR